MNRRGFTLAETVSALAIGTIMLGMVARPVQQLLDRTRIERAAQVVAADLELARSAAQRQRKPVRITFDSVALRLTVADRASGAVLREHSFGSGSELRLRSARFSPAIVDVLPSGMTSAPLSVTLATTGGSRRLAMTRVGLVSSQ